MIDTCQNSTLTSAGGYYLFLSLIRILAVQLVDTAWVAINSSALSPLQLGLLAACAILVSFVDLQSRPAQAASSLGFRILSALAVRPYFKSVPWGRETGDWVPWLLRYRAGGGSISPSSLSPPNSFAGSDVSSTWSGKDVSSFRIPDRKLKASRHQRNQHQQRQRQQVRPSWARTPRAAGWESPSQAGAGLAQLARSNTTPAEIIPPSWQSPLSPRSPLHFTLGVGRPVPRTPPSQYTVSQQQRGTHRVQHRHAASFSEDHSGLSSSGTVFNPNARRSHTIGGDLLSPRSQSTPTPQNAGNTPPCSFSPPCSEGCRTPDLATGATWSSQATASLSSLTARVDAMLRPLVPPAPSNLMRWPSSPASWSFRSGFNGNSIEIGGGADESGSDDGASGISDANNNTISRTRTGNNSTGLHVVAPPAVVQAHRPAARRVSLDANHGCSSRHYTHGGISAHASRRAALERYAYAARMAASSEKAAIFSAFPGRVRGPTAVQDAAFGDSSSSSSSSAIASIGLDGDCPESIRELVTDEHLLQLGALMGETECEKVIKEIGLPFACTSDDALCGAPDQQGRDKIIQNSASAALGWEELTSVENSRPGLRLRSWRLLMRKGLYAYKTVVEIDGIDPSDIRPFHLDDQARELWDDGALEVMRPTPAGCTRASRHAESCLHSYLSKFPGPLASRRYNYARRVWNRPSDGGCYVISQNCEIPLEAINAAAAASSSSADSQNVRAVQVLEFTSAAIIRAVAGGSEISNFYFEDSQVRAGLAKVAVPKGLWPFWSKYEAALRLFADARAVAHSLPPVDALATANTGGIAAGNGAGGSGAGRRRNLDAWNGGSFALAADDAGDDSDGEGSDDELYGALVQLKAARKRAADRRGGALGASTRWARRIVIAGALKMMHVMLATQ